MSATMRCVEAFRRLEVSVFRWILNVSQRPATAPELLPCGIEMDTPSSTDKDKLSPVEKIFDSFLLAVPKSRRSLERRMTRRMGGEKHFETYGLPKNNIVACLECGHWHERHTICGNCYNKVREETRLMQEAMGEDANFYAPQKEVLFLYDKEEEEDTQNKFLVKMERKRPDWFSKTLMTKSGLNNSSKDDIH